jgi:hypothetical protein
MSGFLAIVCLLVVAATTAALRAAGSLVLAEQRQHRPGEWHYPPPGISVTAAT